MEKNLIHSNELHFIDKKRIHRAVGQLVESLELAAGSTTGFNLYAVVESYFTDLNKRREINRLLNPEQNTCEETEEELKIYGRKKQGIYIISKGSNTWCNSLLI